MKKILAVQRREKIKALLLEKDTVTTNEIIDQFGISVETVRRDLDILENEGFLDKIYGGATLKKRSSEAVSHKSPSHCPISLGIYWAVLLPGRTNALPCKPRSTSWRQTSPPM